MGNLNKTLKAFSKKHKIIFSVIICTITLIISMLFLWDDKPAMGIDKLIGDIIITLFCLAVIRVIGIWDGAGFRKSGLGMGLVLGIPFLFIGIGGAIVGNIGVDFSTLVPKSPTIFIIFTLNMFMVGVKEEITIRSFVLNNLLGQENPTYQGTLKAAFISAAIFGAMHIPNIFFVPLITLVVQVINATAAGVLFAAIFVRCRNIWSTIIIHMLVDWFALIIGQCFIGGSSIIGREMSLSHGCLLTIAGSMPPLLIAMFLLRRSKISFTDSSSLK
ncbi:CPBP family intramembrane glutamic endopeptidase [Anaerocolumna sp. MB42-C2]|uniref:CPBP family intramembrane glutamic endopeptidase n=1 Tax=Anaerocolumna sp. MB42-C2 TaxID=3070997 RepID=UPI0027DF2A75|nr:CPBP family intramembrane glutamic endopeptidase [Anaerocolumna sp. MB42-C2]WMJ89222.1 CPBP family intramembrane glutamic endopeptidase [Anaerocolumna sp. MB42-C2]